MNAEAAFAPFLDAPTMRGLLATRLPALLGREARVGEVRLLHSWRKTYARAANAHRAFLLVSYAVEVDAPAGVAADTLLLQGRAALDAEAAPASGTDASPATWPLQLRLPPARLELRRFPDDPALPALPALAARRTVPGCGDLELRARVVSYRPGERCTLAFVDAAGRARAYAKLFADAALAGAVAARLDALAEPRRDRSPSALQVPRRLAVPVEDGVVWTGALEGEPAAALLAAGDAAATSARLAAALAELHGATLPGLVPAPRERRLAEAVRKLRKLAQACAPAADHGDALLARCARLLEDLGREAAPRYLPRHGDVHPGQFRLAAGTVQLFDLDELALGDPEEDLAALVVALQPMPGAPADAGRANALVDAWGARGPRPPCLPLLEFHLRLQWLDRAYRTWWREGLARRAVVEAALQRAAADDPGSPREARP